MLTGKRRARARSEKLPSSKNAFLDGLDLHIHFQRKIREERCKEESRIANNPTIMFLSTIH